jgi:Tol biopolymer transport system component
LQLSKKIFSIPVFFTILLTALFNTDAAGVTPQPDNEKPHLIEVKQAFAYPKNSFLHPLLSPDDKWLLYHRTDIDWSLQKFTDVLFGRVRDIVWKKIFYTRVGRTDKKEVPLPSLKKGNSYRIVGEFKKWSPDGKILAFGVDVDSDTGEGGDRIVLVDFSGNKPVLIESFKSSDSPPVFVLSGKSIFDELLYLNSKQSHLMKRKIGEGSEKAVDFFSGIPEDGRVLNYQIGSDGTIVYSSNVGGNFLIYMTSLAHPSEKSLLSAAIRSTRFAYLIKSKPVFQGYDFTANFDLSPNGRYVVIYLQKLSSKTKRWALLIDLAALKIVDKFSVQENSKLGWSPDGTKLAYVEDTAVQPDPNDPTSVNWPTPHFFIMVLTSGKKTDFGFGVSRRFSWTPDGYHIIYSDKFIREEERDHQTGIFIMRVNDGKEIGQLTRISAARTPYISPSLKYIVWKGINMFRFFVVENPFRPMMINK